MATFETEHIEIDKEEASLEQVTVGIAEDSKE